MDENVEKELGKYVESQENKAPIEVVGGAATPLNIGAPLSETPTEMPWHKSSDKISLGNQVGWQKLPLSDLPTKGLFYPEGTEVAIRSATSSEIRHWSTLREDDPSGLDDMLNYILERCATIKFPTGVSSWKDFKEVDRFYVLLAIREYTFIKGENQLQVKVSESERLDVSKEMIDYINFDDRIMKYYDPEKRLFNMKFKNGKTLELTIPSVGVTGFLKNYIQVKQNSQEIFDTDFLAYAPFVMTDWKGLSHASYEKVVLESQNWDIAQISLLTSVKDIFIETINPVIKYTDERGMEHQAPLNFLGGIKSLFLISDPFGQLV